MISIVPFCLCVLNSDETVRQDIVGHVHPLQTLLHKQKVQLNYVTLLIMCL